MIVAIMTSLKYSAEKLQHLRSLDVVLLIERYAELD
jgi:hypothetical protein